MKSRRFVPILALLVLGSFITLGFDAKGAPKGSATPLVAEVLDNLSTTGAGVWGDGTGTYVDSVGGVQCYFGVSGKDADLVTYNSSRTLHFKFDTSSLAWKKSGLPADFYAVMDFFGVNYWGRYKDMGDGTTAQVQMDLEFKVGNLTYELDYQSLAVKRTGNTWLITSDHANDIIYNTGFTASNQAALNVIRRRSQETFGAVNMPLRVELTLK